MTFEDAIEKVYAIQYPSGHGRDAIGGFNRETARREIARLLHSLQAIGIITFDEVTPPKPETVEDRFRAFLAKNLTPNQPDCADSLTVEEFMMALDDAGFHISQAGFGQPVVTVASWDNKKRDRRIGQ